jgi:hypothetical protein
MSKSILTTAGVLAAVLALTACGQKSEPPAPAAAPATSAAPAADAKAAAPAAPGADAAAPAATDASKNDSQGGGPKL